MAATIARTVAWLAGAFFVVSGGYLVFRAGADAADRWSGAALIALALLFGCLLWLVADLWVEQREREAAERANREREYEAKAATWPHEPG